MKKIMMAALVLLLAASCAVKYQRPEIDTETLVRGSDPADTVFNIAELDWRTFYGDPILCELIDTVLNSNYDLQIAYNRIGEAASYFKQSKWKIAPDLKADVGASYQKSDLINPESPYFRLGLSASWEIDIWGKLTKAKKSRFEKLLAEENSKNAVMTQLIADVASAYFTLIALDTEKKFVLETIENREEYLETVKDLKASAAVNEVAVLQAESQLLIAQGYIPSIDRQIRETENLICYLSGRNPGPVKRSKIKNLAYVLNDIDSTGISANLLRNRPDVIAAEHMLKSSLHNFNSAAAAMYPSLTLTGNISSDATQFNQWFAMPGSLIWGVIGGLTQPIFNGRALRTQKEVARKQYESSIIEFKKTVLNAGMEVSNSLFSLKSNKELTRLYLKQYIALSKAYEFSYELLVNGYATYLDVLSAQEGVFDAQIALIKSLNDVIQDNVNLYRALGGGWTPEPDENETVQDNPRK